MFQRAVIAIAWASLILIVIATLSPIGLRPHMAGPGLERFAAFALIGVLFGLAYPRRIWLVLALIVGTAIGLEALQLLTPDRHGELRDAMVKLAGGISGAFVAVVFQRYLGKSGSAPRKA